MSFENIDSNVGYEYWPLNKFKPYAKNPRKNDNVVNKMTKLIEEYGFIVPMIAKSDGTLIDGHLRLKAVTKLGFDKVPVYIVDHLSDKQVKAFRIAVNKTVELAKWDIELLKGELDDLIGLNYDIDFTGFDNKFINDLNIAMQVGELAPKDGFITPLNDDNVLSSNLPDINNKSSNDSDDDNESLDYSDDNDDDAGNETENYLDSNNGDNITRPLAIVLKAAEFVQWQLYKESIEAKTDTKAFLTLFNAVREK
jgi:hypothetical protein